MYQDVREAVANLVAKSTMLGSTDAPEVARRSCSRGRFSSGEEERDVLEHKQNTDGVKKMRTWTGSREGVAERFEGLCTHRFLKNTAAAMSGRRRMFPSSLEAMR